MTSHVGVLPAELLQALSRQMEDLETHGQAAARGLRFFRIPHPRTGVPALFLPYELPNGGTSAILEAQAVSPANQRSWFMHDEVLEDGKLLVLTPIDPAFLLIPLIRAVHPADGLGTFRPVEDIMEEVSTSMSAAGPNDTSAVISLDDALQLSLLSCVQAAMRRICDTQEITPEITVFRYSPERVQTYLRSKVTRLSHHDISEMSRTLTKSLAKDGLLDDGKEELLTAGRLRVACDLVSQYLPRDIFEQLLATFTALDAHMKMLKEETMALSAAKMNAVEARESRDSKAEKEAGGDKKRKAKVSAGVEKLKKANVKGMSKLSSFFPRK
ncbi:ribonuclease H2, subunit B [Daedaleopsis nitida]|nr:ribonuclease H2, subunit B [Daedaleopsis nitida]